MYSISVSASHDASEAAEGSASDEADAARGGSAADDEPAFENGEWEGSVLADEDGNGPETHPIKGNRDSMLYHTPESRYYKITKAEVWFDTEEHAEAAGFSRPSAGTSSDEGADQENNMKSSAEGSASDEADASREGSEADDEGAN